MKVRELIELLQTIDPEIPVIIAKDEEGNGFNPLYDVAQCHSYKDGYELQAIHPDDFHEYEEIAFPVVCLWP